ncbi:MAG: c-type cytochrome [Pseudomonadota bacterium]|nr:c-type cytochrome [Pseudomonadota bacterium]
MSDKDRVLGHADEADGIEEYDNSLPTWWVGLFYCCIVFAAVYGADYHFLRSRSSASEMEQAIVARPKVEQTTAAAVGPEAIAAGKSVYDTNCVACHGAALEGGVGPNLADTTWIHGGTLSAIQNTISVGVPEKGMLTWGPILGPEKVAQVAAFVHAQGGGQ